MRSYATIALVFWISAHAVLAGGGSVFGKNPPPPSKAFDETRLLDESILLSSSRNSSDLWIETVKYHLDLQYKPDYPRGWICQVTPAGLHIQGRARFPFWQRIDIQSKWTNFTLLAAVELLEDHSSYNCRVKLGDGIQKISIPVSRHDVADLLGAIYSLARDQGKDLLEPHMGATKEPKTTLGAYQDAALGSKSPVEGKLPAP